jgi:hypothetical protein
VLPAAALIAAAAALIRSPRLQALQADGTGSEGVLAGSRAQPDEQAKAAGCR